MWTGDAPELDAGALVVDGDTVTVSISNVVTEPRGDDLETLTLDSIELSAEKCSIEMNYGDVG